MNFGESIRRYREELGMSQEEFATLLGYKHKSSVSNIETGKYHTTFATMYKIAYTLDIPPNKFQEACKSNGGECNTFTKTLHDQYKLTDSEKKILEEYRKTDRITKAAVRKLLNIKKRG